MRFRLSALSGPERERYVVGSDEFGAPTVPGWPGARAHLRQKVVRPRGQNLTRPAVRDTTRGIARAGRGWQTSPSAGSAALRGYERTPAAGPRAPGAAHGIVARIVGMESLLLEYLPILIFFGIAIGLALAMVGASYVVARQSPDPEKDSAYECGFEAFDDARSRFDVRFYLVSILFIIFDLEVAFLFPWAVSLSEIGVFGFWSMVVFLGILTIGFIYEWKKGALEWE
jgi:NADH-quinone oxidoreductase subunit A